MNTNAALKLKPLLCAIDSLGDDVHKRIVTIPASQEILGDGTVINLPEFTTEYGSLLIDGFPPETQPQK